MPSLTCNETIILLDCYRGYEGERHTQGCLDSELKRLIQSGLIATGDNLPESFAYELTKRGSKLAEHILSHVCWEIKFVPGAG